MHSEIFLFASIIILPIWNHNIHVHIEQNLCHCVGVCVHALQCSYVTGSEVLATACVCVLCWVRNTASLQEEDNVRAFECLLRRVIELSISQENHCRVQL